MIIKMLTVFGLGALELWAGVPAGFAFKMNPYLIFILTSGGAASGVFLVIIAGEKIRSFLIKEKPEKEESSRFKKLVKIWEKYGVIGLGILAPWITGAPIGTAIGISLGAPAKKLFFWMLTGILICGAALTIITFMGIAGYKTLLR